MTKHLSKIIVVIGVLLLFGSDLMKVVEVKNHVPLNIEISLSDGVYSISKNIRKHDWDWWPRDTNLYCIHFCISNPISTPCNVGVYNDCYWVEWRTDSTNITVWDWVCDRNFPVAWRLDSTNVYSCPLPIKVHPGTKPGNFSFRMCFKPIKQSEVYRGEEKHPPENFAEGEYWSKEITLTVVP